MSFESQLRIDVERVEAILGNLLDSDRLRWEGVPDRLAAAMRHAVLGAGKRVRPFLVMSSSRMFSVPDKINGPVAAAVELLHCYSLVHDDLPAMDNDRLRRGLPTVWAAFDEWTAILAGDALLTMAFEVLVGERLELSPTRKVELISTLTRASGPTGMVGGQQLDLDAGKRSEPAKPTLTFIEDLQARKTGALLAFSAESGAILAGADSERRAALARYGRVIGLAFQIADDLLDVEGDPDTVGKAVAKDAEAGKATLVALVGPDEARRRLSELREEAIEALSVFDASADVLRDAAVFIASRQH